MGKPPLSHRSTKYPCFVPNLGESMGAGRKGLTHGKINKFLMFPKTYLHRRLILLTVSQENLHFIVMIFAFEGIISKYSQPAGDNWGQNKEDNDTENDIFLLSGNNFWDAKFGNTEICGQNCKDYPNDS